MATGAEFVELGAKRLLGREDFRDRWFGFMRETARENMEQAYRVAGVYDSALGIAADGANKIQITGANKATDGAGHVLDIVAALVSSGIQFENTAAITYEVGLHKTERPDGIQINPRTGYPEYLRSLEEIGERAEPDSVIDNGNGTITIRVDSVTEAGVSNAGRQVMVFLKQPAKNATSAGLAIETRPVVWTGSQNRITTAGDLGQGSGNVSTTASDYEVILLGPTVVRNSSLASTGEHCFLGTVTGNGGTPVAFDTSAQNVIDFSFSDIGDITKRDPGSGHIKIDVKSFSSDVNPAITVRDTVGAPVFTVDRNGNLWVKGTTTQENVVQVNSSETITDNLTAGDADTDSHTIKGNWSHLVGASTKFYVDGATGRVGIGGFDSVGYQLYVTGKTRMSDDVEPATDGGANLGSVGKRWGNLYVINLSFAGDFLPQTDDFQNIGSSSFRWQYGYYSKALGIGDGNNPPLAAIHIDKNAGASAGIRFDRPDTPAHSYALTYDPGGELIFTKTATQTARYRWQEVGDIDANTPADRGVRWTGSALIESAVPKTNYLNLYRRMPAVSNPSEVEWVFDMGGTSTTKTGFRFQTMNSGDFRFRVNANEQMRIASNWVGIGDTTPDANAERFKVNRQWTSAVGANQFIGYFSGNWSVADTGLKMGLGGYATSTHTSGALDSIVGVSGTAQHQGSGTSSISNVVAFRAITYDTGTTNPVNQINFWGQTPSGSPANAYGLFQSNISQGTTNNIAVNIRDVSGGALAAAVAINDISGATANKGIYINSVSGGTDAFGLHMGDVSGASGSNFAIYTNAGDVSFGGATTVRAGGLNVTGAGVFNTSLAVGGTGINITAGGLDVDAGGINVDAGDVNLPAYLRVGNGLYVGSKTGTAYDNDIVVQGGINVGFDGDPVADQIATYDANCYLQGGTSPIWRVDANVPATNSYLNYARSTGVWTFVSQNGSKLTVEPSQTYFYVPIVGAYYRTWLKTSGETDAGTLPVTDGFRMYGDSSNWHGGGNDAFVFEKTDTQLNPDGSIVIATYGTAQIAAAIFNGNGNVRFPSGTTYFNGTNTYIYNHTIATASNFYTQYNGTDPFLYWDATDYDWYDRSSNWREVVIGSSTITRATVNGFEVGLGLSVGAFMAPVNDSILVGATSYGLQYIGGTTGFRLNGRGVNGDMYIQASGLAEDRWYVNSNGQSVIWFQYYPSSGNGNKMVTIHNPIFSTDGSFQMLAITYGPNMALSNKACIYAAGGTANMYGKNESNVVTQLTSHDSVTNEWFFNHYNPRTGETKKIYMERLVEALEELLGESFTEYFAGEAAMYEGTVAQGPKLESVKKRGRGNKPKRVLDAIAARLEREGQPALQAA